MRRPTGGIAWQTPFDTARVPGRTATFSKKYDAGKDFAIKIIDRYAEFRGRGEAWPELKVRLDEFLATVSYPSKIPDDTWSHAETGIKSFSMRSETKPD